MAQACGNVGGTASNVSPTPTLSVPEIPQAEMIYYHVSGTSLPNIRYSLDTNRPNRQPYDAYVGWSVDWMFGGGGHCDPGSAVVNVTSMTVSFPRLVEEDGPVAKTLIRIWNRYADALAMHEAGHVQIVFDALPPMQEAMRAASDCDAAASIGRDWLHRIEEQQIAYDNTTDHGETQGAYFY